MRHATFPGRPLPTMLLAGNGGGNRGDRSLSQMARLLNSDNTCSHRSKWVKEKTRSPGSYCATHLRNNSSRDDFPRFHPDRPTVCPLAFRLRHEGGWVERVARGIRPSSRILLFSGSVENAGITESRGGSRARTTSDISHDQERTEATPTYQDIRPFSASGSDRSERTAPKFGLIYGDSRAVSRSAVWRESTYFCRSANVRDGTKLWSGN